MRRFGIGKWRSAILPLVILCLITMGGVTVPAYSQPQDPSANPGIPDAPLAPDPAPAPEASLAQPPSGQEIEPPAAEVQEPAPASTETDLQTLPAPAESIPETGSPTESDAKLLEINAELDRIQQNASNDTPPSIRTTSPLLDSRSILKAIAGLCLVIALILMLSVALKRLGRRASLLPGADLGVVLGRMHLTPRASLHFIRTGGRILVVGVTQNNVSLVSEFDAADLAPGGQTAESAETITAPKTANAPAAPKPAAPDTRFLEQLKASAQTLRTPPPERPTGKTALKPGVASTTDADIDSLRLDIQRLQQYLKENLRDEEPTT